MAERDKSTGATAVTFEQGSSSGGLASAMGWAYAMDLGARVLGPLITFILAALLGPEEFGILAVALVYVLFIEMIQRQGLSSALVQRRDLVDAHLNSAFWMILAVSVLLTVVSVLLSGWWAGVNDLPELREVIIWLSALLPIQGLILVQEAILRRRMQFRPLALRNTIAATIGGLCGVAAALAGFGVWALVVQQLSMAIIRLLVLWRVADWRPSREFSRTHFVDLLGFSSGSFLTSLGAFVNQRADALFVGLFFGPVAIGLYRFANRMMDQVMAVSLSGSSMMTVALPALSRHQDEPVKFRRDVERLVHLAVTTSFPLFGILAATADPLMRVVGEQWVPTILATQLLCLVGGARALSAMAQPILQSLGHPHRQAVLTWVVAAASAGSFLAVGALLRDEPILTQVSLLAASRAAVYVGVLTPITLWVLSRYGGLGVRAVARLMLPSIVSAVAAWGVGELLLLLIGQGSSFGGHVVRLAAVGVVATGVAFGVLLRFDPRARQILATRYAKLRVGLTNRRARRDAEELQPDSD